MFRQYWTLTLIICILLLFLHQNVSAHMSGPSAAGNAWDVEVRVI